MLFHPIIHLKSTKNDFMDVKKSMIKIKNMVMELLMTESMKDDYYNVMMPLSVENNNVDSEKCRKFFKTIFYLPLIYIIGV